MIASLFAHPDIISDECSDDLNLACTSIAQLSPKIGTHSLRVLASDFLRTVFEAESGLLPSSHMVEICDNLIQSGAVRQNLKLLNLYRACCAVRVFGLDVAVDAPVITDLSIDSICLLHSIVMKGLLPPDQVGCFRTVEVAPRGSPHRYAPYCTIKPKIESLLKSFHDCKSQIAASGKNQLANMIKLAAILFSEFLMIHPFTNGNGRTARLLANFALRDFVRVPFTIDCSRSEYLSALTSRWRSDSCPQSFQPLMRLFVRSFSTAVSHYAWMEKTLNTK